MVDLYARVHSVPLTNAPSINGGNDISIILSQGPGGGGCVGGSVCESLSSKFYPPSPTVCTACTVTQLGPNPLADWITNGNGGTLASYPFINWILLIYIALAIRNAPRAYSSYLKNERQQIRWKDLTILRKALLVFSIGFLGFTTYQFVAIWLSVLVRPVPEFGLIGAGLVLIPVTVWLARSLGWKFPFYKSAATLQAPTQ